MNLPSKARSVGLPDRVEACLFDLDGVLTPSARVHAAAWKELFDVFLRAHAERCGERFVPFDDADDYRTYVDGKPRRDGVRAFLAARDISLPEGDATDPAGAATVAGLAKRKDELFLRELHSNGMGAYPGSVRYVHAAREAGLSCAIVSSSSNARAVLEAAGVEALFDRRIDGVSSARAGLRGKPAPDTFLAGARALGVEADQAAVFEDALAGVAAGRAGGFACVVGVDRVGQAAALRARGADLVVADLSELLE